MTIPDSHPLTGTEWELTAIDTAESTAMLTPAQQQRHTIAFAADGTLQMQLDCNRGRSSWTAGQPVGGAGSISIAAVISTRMACPEPSFGTELSRLAEAQRYTLASAPQALVIETPELRYTFTAAR